MILEITEINAGTKNAIRVLIRKEPERYVVATEFSAAWGKNAELAYQTLPEARAIYVLTVEQIKTLAPLDPSNHEEG